MKPVIVLFADFGMPYSGQVKAVLYREAPEANIIDLFIDAPAHDPKAAAYLLEAYVGEFPEEAVFLAVVDPGVGGMRGPGVLRVARRWYVGPDNGLFEMVIRRCPGEPIEQPRWWEISWRPDGLSATFHGRDLFAPIAARIAMGEGPDGIEKPIATVRRLDWPDELEQIIYIDNFGNAITGVRAESAAPEAEIRVGGQWLKRAETFSDVSPGQAFCYENSNGLLEIAVNQGRADSVLGLEIGSLVTVGEV
ncbi:MAG: SAM-dependent chlorinase/fluorinase [Rhodospirillales bacterium]